MINKPLVRPRIMSDAFSRNMEDEKKEDWMKCPSCGSKNISHISGTQFKCKDCGEKLVEV